jgi:hypothetical protein
VITLETQSSSPFAPAISGTMSSARAVDRGSESDPVAAVRDLEADEKKPRGAGIRGSEDGAAENATKRHLVAAIEGLEEAQ